MQSLEECHDSSSTQGKTASSTESKERSSSLLDKLTAESFTLDCDDDQNKKRKTKKADFFKENNCIAPSNDKNDPFGDLDPMWVMKQ